MTKNKVKAAFFDFTGCEGCQLTVLDTLQTHLDLLQAVEIVQFREAMSEKGDNFQIAFVEGSCTRPEDEERLRLIRSQADKVFALGACAHLGGVNALINWQAREQAQRYVYGSAAKMYANERPRPAGEVITIDGFIPGCPVNREEVVRVIKALLQGRPPFIPDYPVCVECKRKENLCVFLDGKSCLGAVTRAGCDAECPTYGKGCMACRGLVSNPGLAGLKLAFNLQGRGENDYNESLKLFQTLHLKAN